MIYFGPCVVWVEEVCATNCFNFIYFPPSIDADDHYFLMMEGMVYGNAENAWAYFSDRDDRMQPYAEDGSPQRAHLLLITKSLDVTVRDLKLHNSTDWTFRAVRNVNCVNSVACSTTEFMLTCTFPLTPIITKDESENIYVDNVDIYGDSRYAFICYLLLYLRINLLSGSPC